jgi:hypothetical protein
MQLTCTPKEGLGEILDQFGARIERDYQEKTEKIKTDPTLNAAGRKKFLDYQPEAYSRRIANFQKIKAKYQNRRQEPATVYTEQPSIYLENQLPDLFEGEGPTSRRIPIYKFEPAMIKTCTTADSQWILVEWSAEGVKKIAWLQTGISRSPQSTWPRFRKPI